MRAALLLLCVLASCPGADTYMGQRGRWVRAVLTAYSPLDAFTRDDVNNPLRLTSTGKRTGRHPYGVAADPLALPYGTRVIIPLGIGYLDRTRPSRRTFPIDDTGAIIRDRTRETGVLHLDLRYETVYSATKFGKKEAWVFIVEDAHD